MELADCRRICHVDRHATDPVLVQTTLNRILVQIKHLPPRNRSFTVVVYSSHLPRTVTCDASRAAGDRHEPDEGMVRALREFYERPFLMWAELASFRLGESVVSVLGMDVMVEPWMRFQYPALGDDSALHKLLEVYWKRTTFQFTAQLHFRKIIRAHLWPMAIHCTSVRVCCSCLKLRERTQLCLCGAVGYCDKTCQKDGWEGLKEQICLDRHCHDHERGHDAGEY
jgi:hypothetical protein